MTHILAGDYSDFIESFTSSTEQYFKKGATERDINSLYPQELPSVLRDANIDKLWDSDGNISLLKFGLILENIARYDCSSAALTLTNYVCPAMLLESVQLSDELDKIAQDVRHFNKSIALAMFENSAKMNHTALSTVCRSERDGFSLRGLKRNVLGATNSDYLIVSSVQEQSEELYFHLVESQMAEVDIQKCDSVLGLRSAGFSDVTFEDARLADSMVVTTDTDSYELTQNIQKIINIGTAFIALGFARAAYEKSLARSLKRKQFHRAIIDFQAIQLKLSKMYAQISSLDTYLYSITENSLDAMSLRDIFSAKILATDYATEISNETVQIFAGYGYIKDDGIDRFMRDSKVLQVFPESNEVLHMQIANELKSIHSKK